MKTESKRILIVDDDYYFRSTLERFLKQDGHEVSTAENGRHARELLGLQEMDLVISDIRMPEVSGIELLSWIQEKKPVPVILMTGFSDLIEAHDAASTGAAGFLAKPFKREDLQELIKTCCPVAQLEPEPQNFDPQYCKIGIEDFVSGREMKHDIYIRISESKYIKISHSGENIELSRIRAYKDKGIHFLYMLKGDFQKYLNFNLVLAKAVTQSSEIERQKKLNFVKHVSEVILENLHTSEIQRDDFLQATAMVENSVTLLGENSDAVDLLAALANHTNFLYAHSVAVSFYSTLIGKAMGWRSPSSVIKLSLGGLLHDIGKKELPQELVSKPRSQLTAAEVGLMESHALRGTDMLARLQCIPTEVIQIVAEHHEDCQGFGYPNHLRKAKIQPMARVVALTNDLCNLVVKNPDSQGMKPAEAIQRLALSLKRYDEAPFHALLRVFHLDNLEKEYFGASR